MMGCAEFLRFSRDLLEASKEVLAKHEKQ